MSSTEQMPIEEVMTDLSAQFPDDLELVKRVVDRSPELGTREQYIMYVRERLVHDITVEDA